MVWLSFFGGAILGTFIGLVIGGCYAWCWKHGIPSIHPLRNALAAYRKERELRRMIRDGICPCPRCQCQEPWP